MERDMNQALPALCRGGCGFYGSPASEGLCSKCFKDTLKRKQDPGHSPTSSITPKAVDPSSNHDRAFVAAMESLVSPTQASTSNVAAGLEPLNTAVLAKVAIQEKDVATPSSTPDTSAEGSPCSSPMKQKNRCDTCRKKVGLTGFQCRCGGMYCAIHRYSDMHECSFDYQSLGKEEIRKNNPVVKTEKVVKL